MKSVTFQEFVSTVKIFDNYEIKLMYETERPNGRKHWVAEIKTESNYFTPTFLKYCVRCNVGFEFKNNMVIIDG